MPPVSPPQSTPSPTVPHAWWLPTLSAAEHEAAAGEAAGPGPAPVWAGFVERALAHAAPAADRQRPAEPISSAPGLGPEGRLLHPLRSFLTAADELADAGPAAADRRAVWSGPGSGWRNGSSGWPGAPW